jgi:hypothetical protein
MPGEIGAQGQANLNAGYGASAGYGAAMQAPAQQQFGQAQFAQQGQYAQPSPYAQQGQFAQTGQMGMQCPGAQAQMGMQGTQNVPGVGLHGHLRGTVENLNLSTGQVWVNANGREVMLRGSPRQLAALTPGESVRVGYGMFGTSPWILWTGQSEQMPPQVYGNVGNAMGTVTGINKSSGLIEVATASGNELFQAHPRQIQTLTPGEFVSLSFARVGNADWVTGIRTR